MSNQQAIDDLKKFISKKSEVQIPVGNIPLESTALPLSDYQIEGVQFALQHRGVLIGDEMGVGKTPQGVAIALSAVRAGSSPVLVVVPPSMRLQWMREFTRFAPSLKVATIEGRESEWIGGSWKYRNVTTGVGARKKTERVRYRDGGVMKPLPVADVLLIGDMSVHGYSTQLKEVVKAIIIDECHRIKGKGKRSKRAQACIDIARSLPAKSIRVAMSGTPLINHPMDLLNIIQVIDRLDDFADNGKTGLEYYLGKFAPRLDRFGTRGVAHLDELHQRLIDGIMIRRKREEVLTLPNKGRITHHVELQPKIAKAYLEAESNLFAFIELAKGTPSAERAMKAEAISLLNTLRELVAHGKVPAVVAYVQSLLEEDEQVFITCTHRAVAEAYVNHLSKYTMPNGKACRVVRVEGGMTDSAKMASVDAFQAGEANVLVGNVIASGVGITLTSARHHVSSCLPWTSADLLQCEDRLARRGQKREVVSHIILGCIEGNLTVDERLFALIDAKCGVLNAVLDGAEYKSDNSNLINDDMTSSATAVLESYGWTVREHGSVEE